MKLRSFLVATATATLGFSVQPGFGTAVARAQTPAPPADAPPAEGDASDAAEPDPEARQAEAALRFERGLTFYRDGEYRLALIEFDRTYELVPDYRVLYNIGQVSMQLGQHARARRAFERYLAEGAGDVSEERKAQVSADLEMLAERTAFVSVEVSEAGAEIVINDEPVGVSPLSAPVLVDAGRLVVTARLGATVAPRQVITVAGGDEVKVALELPSREPVTGGATRAPPVVAPPTTPPTGQVEPTAPYGKWWLGWAATGALGAAAGVTGGLGLAAAAENRDLQGSPTTTDELEASREKAARLLDVSGALGIGAVVVGGASIFVTVRHFRGERADASNGASAPRNAGRGSGPRATVFVGPASVGVRGRF